MPRRCRRFQTGPLDRLRARLSRHRLRGRTWSEAATGLDFSSAMLAVASRGRGGAIRFDEGDAEALPDGDDAFDAVVSNFGIHHVPRPALALR